jgi:hypothetical protein
MTSFDQLLRHLRAVQGQPDPDAMRAARVWLRDFKRERDASLPRTPLEALGREETGLYSLRLAGDLLEAVLTRDHDTSLRVAQALLELPLRADPFGGELFMLAAAVTESAGGDPRPFRAQRERYQARFGRARAVAGLGRVLGDPQLLEMLENVADAPAEVPLSVPHSPPEGGFVPFAGGEDELPRSYPVEVRWLLEPRTARFTVTVATLVDLSGGDGRFADGLADMFLDFGDVPLPDEPLGLRFIFTGAEAVETFAAADGTLFDTEVALSEGRFYFKLRLPESWQAAPWPRHALWSRLECCVLLESD